MIGGKGNGRGRLTLKQPLPLAFLRASDVSCCCEEGKGRGGRDQREGASEESEGETDERKREGTQRKQGRKGRNNSREEGEGGGKLGREWRKGKGKGKGRNQ